LADLVKNVGAPKSWPELCEALARRGFLLTEGRFVGELTSTAPPAAPIEVEPPEAEAEEAQTIPEIEADVTAAAEPAQPPVEEPVAEAEPRERPRSRVLETTEDVLAGVIEEIEGRSEEVPEETAESETLTEAAPPSEVPEQAVEEAEAPDVAASVEEIEQQWLRELEREGVGTGVLEPPVDEFVDLATELEAELIEEGGLGDDLLPSVREQSLEDIVEGFRTGGTLSRASGSLQMGGRIVSASQCGFGNDARLRLIAKLSEVLAWA
jgi:hypothetical protein